MAEEGRDGKVHSHGRVPNKRSSVAKLVKKLGEPKRLQVCDEADPCGYVLYWQLTELGAACELVAPTLIPVKAGDRANTEKRDSSSRVATERANSRRCGFQTARTRQCAIWCVLARQPRRTTGVHGNVWAGSLFGTVDVGRKKTKAWVAAHMDWLRRQSFNESHGSIHEYQTEPPSTKLLDRCLLGPCRTLQHARGKTCVHDLTGHFISEQRWGSR